MAYHITMKPIFLLLAAISLQLAAQESLTEVRKHAYGNPFDPANQDVINLLNRTSSPGQVSFLLFESWKRMNVQGMDNTQLRIDSANYHIVEDKIFFLSHGKLYELHPDRIKHVILDHRAFVHTAYEIDGRRVGPGFFEVLEGGEYSLLRKFEIKKEVKNDHPMGIPAATEVSYKKDEKYFYFREGSDLPEAIPTNKKDFIMIFRKRRPEMAIFARENRISLRSEDDLKTIFAYYNGLVSQ